MIRAKITPTITSSGGVYVRVDWCDVVEEKVVSVIAFEEFVIQKDREGASYVSKVAVENPVEMGGTFWLDEKGNRHFIVNIDPLLMNAVGEGIGLKSTVFVDDLF